MAKVNILPLIIFILAGQLYAEKNDLFLEGLEGVVRIDFSDGSIYKGQVDDELKAIYHIKDTVCIWILKTREDRNQFMDETAGMLKDQREIFFENFYKL